MIEAPSIKEVLELKPCPFCGGKGRVYQLQSAKELWRVRYENCDVGPNPTFGAKDAVNAWNTRSAVATLQPSGERREAIARIARSVLMDDPKSNDPDKWLVPLDIEGVDDLCEQVADAILASGLVQDEAAIRADEREKIVKDADKKAADLLDAAEKLRAYIGATKLAYTEADLHEQAGTVVQAFAAAIRSARDGELK